MQAHLEAVNLHCALNEIFMILHKGLVVEIKIVFLDNGDKKLDFGYILVEILHAVDKIPYLVLEFDLFVHFKLKEECILFSTS